MNAVTEKVIIDQTATAVIESNNGLTAHGFAEFVSNIEDMRRAHQVQGDQIIATKFEALLRAAIVMDSSKLNAVLKAAYNAEGIEDSQKKTLQNWASVVRNCYGAVRFCGIHAQELATLGRDGASELSANALKERGILWTGNTAEDRERKAAKRKIKAEMAAALELMDTDNKLSQEEALTKARQLVQEKTAQNIVNKYAKRLVNLLNDFMKDTGQTDAHAAMNMLLDAAKAMVSAEPASM